MAGSEHWARTVDLCFEYLGSSTKLKVEFLKCLKLWLVDGELSKASHCNFSLYQSGSLCHFWWQISGIGSIKFRSGADKDRVTGKKHKPIWWNISKNYFLLLTFLIRPKSYAPSATQRKAWRSPWASWWLIAPWQANTSIPQFEISSRFH